MDSTMLSVQGLTKTFGGFTAVNQVSFELQQGEILGLIGPNGSGKSTTFNLLAGALMPTRGSIRFLGREIGGHPAYRITHYGIARTYQIPRPFRRLSLLENVALASYYGQTERPAREKAYEQAKEALDLVNLPSHASARVDGLGTAALKKLELARALATQPQLLLADESLGGLDESEMEQAAALLSRIRAHRGITIIWVEHIMGVLMRVVDRCLVLDHGEVIAQGKPEQVAHDPRVIEVYLGTDARDVQATVAARSA
jgi:branched-chain amino acid transport system ATP-binding protein